ncbi:MAG: DMT family transporter [Alphaproteobacteria bacterium]|nr:DMT family transporter [Alphaproteobacteria bacterium]
MVTTATDPAGRPRLLPLIAIFAGSFCFALTPVFVKSADVGPIAAGFWRMVLALPLIWAWCRIEARRRGRAPEPRPSRSDVRWLAASAVAIAADLSLWHSSFIYTSVANAAVLGSLHPIVVAIGAWFLFREAVTRTFVVGLVVAVAGAIALARAGAGEFSAVALGDVLAVLSTLGFSAYALTLKRLRQTLPTATIMLWTLALAPAMLLPIGAAAGETLLPQSTQGWLVVAGFALIGNIAGQSMMTYAFAHLPASFGAVTLLVVPVFAALFAWLLFGETVSAAQAIAGAAVLAGIVLAERGRRRPRDGRRGSRR